MSLFILFNEGYRLFSLYINCICISVLRRGGKWQHRKIRWIAAAALSEHRQSIGGVTINQTNRNSAGEGRRGDRAALCQRLRQRSHILRSTRAALRASCTHAAITALPRAARISAALCAAARSAQHCVYTRAPRCTPAACASTCRRRIFFALRACTCTPLACPPHRTAHCMPQPLSLPLPRLRIYAAASRRRLLATIRRREGVTADRKSGENERRRRRRRRKTRTASRCFSPPLPHRSSLRRTLPPIPSLQRACAYFAFGGALPCWRSFYRTFRIPRCLLPFYCAPPPHVRLHGYHLSRVAAPPSPSCLQPAHAACSLSCTTRAAHLRRTIAYRSLPPRGSCRAHRATRCACHACSYVYC